MSILTEHITRPFFEKRLSFDSRTGNFEASSFYRPAAFLFLRARAS